MKSTTKKVLLIASIAFLGVSSMIAFAGATYAGFEKKETIIDKTSGSDELEISAQGIRMTTYYLDIGIWGNADNSSINFYALVFKNDDHTTFEFILGTPDGSNYKYSLDRAVYDRIKFCRMSSSNTPEDYEDSDMTDNGGYSINATHNLSFDSRKTTYQITSWTSTGAYGFLSAGEWR